MTNDWKCCEKEPPRKLGEEIEVREKRFNFSLFMRYTGIDYVYEKFSLSTINFLGEKFNCPLIPEKYLECKYGQDWGTLKKQWDYAYSPLNHLRTNIYIDQKIVKGKFLKWLKSYRVKIPLNLLQRYSLLEKNK
jgi:hypothetical protein